MQGQNENWPKPSLQTWRWCRMKNHQRIIMNICSNEFGVLCKPFFNRIFLAWSYKERQPEAYSQRTEGQQSHIYISEWKARNTGDCCNSKRQSPVSPCNILGTEEVKWARQKSDMCARNPYSCIYEL